MLVLESFQDSITTILLPGSSNKQSTPCMRGSQGQDDLHAHHDLLHNPHHSKTQTWLPETSCHQINDWKSLSSTLSKSSFQVHPLGRQSTELNADTKKTSMHNLQDLTLFTSLKRSKEDNLSLGNNCSSKLGEELKGELHHRRFPSLRLSSRCVWFKRQFDPSVFLERTSIAPCSTGNNGMHRHPHHCR